MLKIAWVTVLTFFTLHGAGFCSASCKSKECLEEDSPEAAHFVQLKGAKRRHVEEEDAPPPDPPLNEVGFTYVADQCCKHKMEVYIRRVIDSMGLKICDEGGLMGLVPWCTCANRTVQSLASLKEYLESSSQSTGEGCGFLTDSSEGCTPADQLPAICQWGLGWWQSKCSCSPATCTMPSSHHYIASSNNDDNQ